MIDITAAGSEAPVSAIQVLVLDEDPSFLRQWRHILHNERYQLSVLSSAAQALQVLRTEVVDVMVVDISMHEMDGMRFLAEARAIDRDVPVITTTKDADVRQTVDAMRLGAYDSLGKPFANTGAVELTVLRAAERYRLTRRVRELESEQTGAGMQGFIGNSPAVTKLKEMVQVVAASDATVLICGESGTGKELIAHAIHEGSSRRNKLLQAINCSAFAETLLEEELFGHAKGAFTGADARKAGIFEAANGGTVFLDEVADMSLACQAKLLRTLQEGEVRPVGSTATLKVNVRIVAATNIDLDERCTERRFRRDLFYRLNVVRIDVPPLRERPDDIPLLVAHFLRHYQNVTDKRLDGIRPSTLEQCARYPWPGNVRELKNMVERAVLLSPANRKLSASDFPTVRKATTLNQPIEVEVLPPAPRPIPESRRLPAARPPAIAPAIAQCLDVPFNEAKARVVEQFERSYLTGLLERHGSITAAAEAAGLDRSNFKRLLRRYDLSSCQVSRAGEAPPTLFAADPPGHRDPGFADPNSLA